jgi:hypothetical protein
MRSRQLLRYAVLHYFGEIKRNRFKFLARIYLNYRDK